ncbi:MAG: HAD-IC family P-type ATPase, partial [Bacilli bacterium]|nr:HAD-IC family P-type ATPase [Bacilli bacterium]
IKGTSYFDELVMLKKLVSDKTGTMTKGSFEIAKVVTSKEVKEEELLDALYAAECLSSHPIAKAICHEKDLEEVAKAQKDFLEIAGFGVETTYVGKKIYAGNVKLMEKANVSPMVPSEVGTIIHVAKDNVYLGYVVLSDSLKDEAKTLVDYMHKEKIEMILLTGDKKENAEAISNELKIDRCYSELLPEDKTKYLEKEMSKDHDYSTAYIGDGINDAASIRMADIGIAMGAIGSDVAVENADIVIMNDDPSKVKDAYKISKIAQGTAKFNLITALAVKLSIEAVAIAFSLLNYFNVSSWSLPMWAAVLADTGLTVALVINSLFVLYRKIK